VIRKTFISTKDFCTYPIKIVRQEKILRDDGSGRPVEVRLTEITAKSAGRARRPGPHADNSKKRLRGYGA
jgi:hypothetical protein